MRKFKMEEGNEFFSLILNCNEVPAVNWITTTGGINKEKVRVVYSSEYDRKVATDDFERNIETVWNDRLRENPNLYNGSKFRLAKLSLESGFVKIYLGLTCYRDYICTNMSTEHAKLLRDYGVKYKNDQQACFSDALSEEAIVLSSDNQVIFVRRSDKVFEASGKFAFPGGHPEPDMISKNLRLLQEFDSKHFVYELYHSMVREVRDEINIPEKHLEFPTLLGIGRNKVTNGRPEMIFLIRCSLSSQEIREYYNEGGPEAYESTQLQFVHIDELKNQVSSCYVNPSDKMNEILSNAAPGVITIIKLFFNNMY